MQYIVYTYSLQSTHYNIHCTMYILHFKLCSLQCTLYTVQFTPFTVNCTLYTLDCTPYNMKWMLCHVICALYTVRPQLYMWVLHTHRRRSRTTLILSNLWYCIYSTLHHTIHIVYPNSQYSFLYGFYFIFCSLQKTLYIISFLTMQWNTEIKLFNISLEWGVYYTVHSLGCIRTNCQWE